MLKINKVLLLLLSTVSLCAFVHAQQPMPHSSKDEKLQHVKTDSKPKHPKTKLKDKGQSRTPHEKELRQARRLIMRGYAKILCGVGAGVIMLGVLIGLSQKSKYTYKQTKLYEACRQKDTQTIVQELTSNKSALQDFLDKRDEYITGTGLFRLFPSPDTNSDYIDAFNTIISPLELKPELLKKILTSQDGHKSFLLHEHMDDDLYKGVFKIIVDTLVNKLEPERIAEILTEQNSKGITLLHRIILNDHAKPSDSQMLKPIIDTLLPYPDLLKSVLSKQYQVRYKSGSYADANNKSVLFWAAEKGWKKVMETVIDNLKTNPKLLYEILMSSQYNNNTRRHDTLVERVQMLESITNAFKENPEYLTRILMDNWWTSEYSRWGTSTMLGKVIKKDRVDIIDIIFNQQNKKLLKQTLLRQEFADLFNDEKPTYNHSLIKWRWLQSVFALDLTEEEKNRVWEIMQDNGYDGQLYQWITYLKTISGEEPSDDGYCSYDEWKTLLQRCLNIKALQQIGASQQIRALQQMRACINSSPICSDVPQVIIQIIIAFALPERYSYDECKALLDPCLKIKALQQN